VVEGNTSESLYKTSRVDHVANTIIQGIKEGRYVPGQRLVEADMTRDLNISRGPLREALRLLAAVGLLELVPNRGAIIRRLSVEDVINRYRLLDVLGKMAIESSIINEDVLSYLETEVISKCKEDNSLTLGCAAELYSFLARSQDNTLLVDLIRRLNVSSFSKYMIFVTKLNNSELWEKFSNVVSALQNNNHEKALKAHKKWAKTLLPADVS